MTFASRPGSIRERTRIGSRAWRRCASAVPLDVDAALRDRARRPSRQSFWCTVTPRPRVTKPTTSSPGSGAQQSPKRTSTSRLPVHADAGCSRPSARAGTGARRGAGFARCGSARRSAGCSSRTSDGRREPAVADRGEQIVDRAARRRAARARRARRPRARAAARARPCAARGRAARGRARGCAPSPRRGSRGGSCCAPCPRRRSRASPCAAAARALVRISTVSPSTSLWRSGTSLPFTCAPAQCVADLAVDRVGEVDRRRAARQVDHVALRREHEHLVGEQVDLHRLEELVRVVELAGGARSAGAARRTCCRRVGADACPSLYFQCAAIPSSASRCISLRADLHLHALAVGADHRRVQRLVAVRLRQRDVVLEAARHRRARSRARCRAPRSTPRRRRPRR